MTPLEGYNAAALKLANAVATYWPTWPTGDPAFAPLVPLVDAFNDACSVLARESAQLDEARRRHRIGLDRDAWRKP